MHGSMASIELINTADPDQTKWGGHTIKLYSYNQQLLHGLEISILHDRSVLIALWMD